MRKVPKRRRFDHLCINYCLLSELFVTLLKIKIKNPQHFFTFTPIKKFRNFIPKKKIFKENKFVSSLSNPSVWFLLTTTKRLLLQTQSSDLRKVLLKKFCDIKFGSHTTTCIFP
jgi:hypothetical protein